MHKKKIGMNGKKCLNKQWPLWNLMKKYIKKHRSKPNKCQWEELFLKNAKAYQNQIVKHPWIKS